MELHGIRDWLSALVPQDADDALDILEFLSAASSEGERLKKVCYGILNDASPRGEYEHNGVTFVRIQQTKTIWNRTGELVQAEAELKEAKNKLEQVQRKGGFTTVPGNDFWQRKKPDTEEA